MNNWHEVPLDSTSVYVECKPNKEDISVIKIEHLTKIECREDVLNELQSSHLLLSKYRLGVKRLNRWWYSVSFIDKIYDNKY